MRTIETYMKHYENIWKMKSYETLWKSNEKTWKPSRIYEEIICPISPLLLHISWDNMEESSCDQVCPVRCPVTTSWRIDFEALPFYRILAADFSTTIPWKL